MAVQKILFVGGPYEDQVAKCDGQLQDRIYYPDGDIDRIYKLALFKHPEIGEMRYFYVESEMMCYAPEPCNFGSAEAFILDHWNDDYDSKDIAIAIKVNP